MGHPDLLIIMAENEVKQIIQQIDNLNALVPAPKTPSQHLLLATTVLEYGALSSIRLKDTDSFTRYYQQLQPFYSLPADRWGRVGHPGNQSKVTGAVSASAVERGRLW